MSGMSEPCDPTNPASWTFAATAASFDSRVVTGDKALTRL